MVKHLKTYMCRTFFSLPPLILRGGFSRLPGFAIATWHFAFPAWQALAPGFRFDHGGINYKSHGISWNIIYIHMYMYIYTSVIYTHLYTPNTWKWYDVCQDLVGSTMIDYKSQVSWDIMGYWIIYQIIPHRNPIFIWKPAGRIVIQGWPMV